MDVPLGSAPRVRRPTCSLRIKVDGCRFGSFSWKRRNCFVGARNCFTASCLVIPGRCNASNPESRDSGFALRAPRNDGAHIYTLSADALPGLAAAEHAAEGATLDA